MSAHLKIQPPLPGFTDCLQQEKPFTSQPSQRLGRTVTEDHSQWDEAALGVPKWAWCQGWTTVKEVNTTLLLSLSVISRIMVVSSLGPILVEDGV